MILKSSYEKLKSQYDDALLMFRIGDFYEFVWEDARKASEVLDLFLTSRCGFGEMVPMCGIPYRHADAYIATLVAEGYKVAVCEQGV